MRPTDRRHGPGRRDRDYECEKTRMEIRDAALAQVEHKLNRNYWTMLVVFLLLVAGGALDYADRNHQDFLRDRAATNQCNRLQEQRDDDNANAWYQQHADLKLATIIVEPGILKVLGRKDRTERVTAAADYKAIATSIKYEPPTNCARAVSDPHYRRPKATAFPAHYRPSR